MTAGISYRFDKQIPVDAWLRLYHASGYNRDWMARNAQTMLAHAYLAVTAWEANQLVGTLSMH